MIPKKIYFAFGFAPNFGDRPFTIAHYLAIKSAREVNQCPVFLYYHYKPKDNIWWNHTENFCTHVQCEPPSHIYGVPLVHPAYKADIFRMNILNTEGGIYLDIDSICIKPFDDLLNNSFVMGQEVIKGEVLGLCNAVMLAEPHSKFAELWFEEYKNHYDDRWGVMQVRRPLQIFRNNPLTVTVLPKDAFFKYGWDDEDLKRVHEEVSDMSGAYALHLWEQKSYDKYLAPMTVQRIQTLNTTYTLLARRFL